MGQLRAEVRTTRSPPPRGWLVVPELSISGRAATLCSALLRVTPPKWPGLGRPRHPNRRRSGGGGHFPSALNAMVDLRAVTKDFLHKMAQQWNRCHPASRLLGCLKILAELGRRLPGSGLGLQLFRERIFFIFRKIWGVSHSTPPLRNAALPISGGQKVLKIQPLKIRCAGVPQHDHKGWTESS